MYLVRHLVVAEEVGIDHTLDGLVEERCGKGQDKCQGTIERRMVVSLLCPLAAAQAEVEAEM